MSLQNAPLWAALNPPALLDDIQRDTAQLGFTMGSEPLTGLLLRVLVASKPGGTILEIGTGTGIGTCWLLSGMDDQSRLTSVDRDAQSSAVAQKYLSSDARVTFVVMDAEQFIKQLGAHQFDLIFADTFPGKFYLLDEVLNSLKVGGLYVIDDLLPQETWPAEHQANVDRLIAELESRSGVRVARLDWASGLMIVTKTA